MSIHALFVFLFNISSVHLCTIPLSFCVLFIEHPESVSVIYAAEVNHVKTYNLLVTEPDETGDKNSFYLQRLPVCDNLDFNSNFESRSIRRLPFLKSVTFYLIFFN